MVVQLGAAGWDPQPVAGDLRAPEPGRHRDDPAVLQSEHRVFHFVGDADQRHLFVDDLRHRGRARRVDDIAPLHEPGPADARRSREPAAGAARRSERQWCGRRSHGSCPASWRAWPVYCSPRCSGALQPQRLRHFDGDGDRSRGLGAACAPCRSPPLSPTIIGVPTTVLQGYIPPNNSVRGDRPVLPFLFLAAALLFLPGCASWTRAVTRWPPSTHHLPRLRRPPGAEHGPDHPDPVVDPVRRLLRVDADLDARRMGDGLQQRA